MGQMGQLNLDSVKKVYFIGIGGSSMSSLAEILKLRGYEVCGSDMQQSHTVEHLEKMGICVTVGQKAENIANFQPCLLYTSKRNPCRIFIKQWCC